MALQPSLFQQTIRDLRRGLTQEEASEALQELVAAVRATGKKGTLTLTLEVKMMGREDDVALTIHDKIVVKAPEHDRSATIMYANDDGGLQREDPRQLAMELKTVDTEDAAPVQVG